MLSSLVGSRFDRFSCPVASPVAPLRLPFFTDLRTFAYFFAYFFIGPFSLTPAVPTSLLFRSFLNHAGFLARCFHAVRHSLKQSDLISLAFSAGSTLLPKKRSYPHFGFRPQSATIFRRASPNANCNVRARCGRTHLARMT